MRKLAVILIFLISLQTISASDKEYGKISVVVINRIPQIINISITPEIAYEDSTLICDAVADDESPATVTMHYEWYTNDVKLENTGNQLSNFKAGDRIKCIAAPEDTAHQFGELKEITIVIQNTPLGARIIKPALNLIRIKTTTEQISQQASMQAITGMVTGTGSQNSPNLVLLLLVFILIIANINLLGRHLARRTRFPKQD